MDSYSSMDDDRLLDAWDSEADFKKRDEIIRVMQERKLFPSEELEEIEDETGEYPSQDDPEFIRKLLSRKEFADSYQESWKSGIKLDPCSDETSFEITPVQRFVANFMAPSTPYMSALLYHGVGVGKTCAGIQIAEAWLGSYTYDKVMIIAPRTIQDAFLKTIFDITKVIIPENKYSPNVFPGCTGDTYFRLTGTLFEKDRSVIEKKVKEMIKMRYEFYGYVQISNRIAKIIESTRKIQDDEERKQEKYKRLRNFFNYRLILIDEAHNLNGTLPTKKETKTAEVEEKEESEEEAQAETETEEQAEAETDEETEAESNSNTKSVTSEFTEEEKEDEKNIDAGSEVGGDDNDDAADFPGGKTQREDSISGQKLRILLTMIFSEIGSEGIKLVLLTATPMYNSYKEIINILNLLLINDKKAMINESLIFDEEGKITESGSRILGSIAQKYVSFMRGENPLSFPIRLYPTKNRLTIEDYPTYTIRGALIEPEEKIFIDKLPIINIPLEGENLKAATAAITKFRSTFLDRDQEKMRLQDIGIIANACNFIVPETSVTRGKISKRSEGGNLSYVFDINNKEQVYTAKKDIGAKWLLFENIKNYSQKFYYFLKKIRKAEGVIFGYTAYVKNGALPLGLILEANGYTLFGRKPYLTNGIQTGEGRQCALCEHREKTHPKGTHDFKPAYYCLITGDQTISPKNVSNILAERSKENVNGEKIKVVIGSQVAAEGVDFRYIREIHVLDPWYHLNKIEQIIGRGVRFLSHCALPPEKRNTTIYLYATTLPKLEMSNSNSESNNSSNNSSNIKDEIIESPDLYIYRKAYLKARLAGDVSRILKMNAVDCNLNINAVIIQGQKPVTQINSQRQELTNVSINDMPFTAICDWAECDYSCIPKVDVPKLEKSYSSFSGYAAKWREQQIKNQIRNLFSRQSFYTKEDILESMDIIQDIKINILSSIINNKSFQVFYNGKPGYVRYCNNYFVFQPYVYFDVTIPLSIRSARFPIKRDTYIPTKIELAKVAAEEVSESKEVTNDAVDSDAVYKKWKKIVTWVKSEHKNYDEVSTPSGFDRYNNIFTWFFKKFKNYDALESVILEYFFDNNFRFNEQKALLFKNDELIKKINRDYIDISGGNEVVRLINPSRGIKDGGPLEFVFLKGEFNQVIIDDIIKNKNDISKTSIINTKTTGIKYGFLSIINNKLLLKWNKTPLQDLGVLKGTQCSNVSNKIPKVNIVNEIGKILDNDFIKVSEHDFDKISFCIVVEILFRYIDKLKLIGKKWFYRPVSQYYASELHPKEVPKPPQRKRQPKTESKK
jgi:hypothetical protein